MRKFVFTDESGEMKHILPIINGPIDAMGDIFDEKLCGSGFMNNLETSYGVHDVSFNNNTDMWGFSSYEVEPQKWTSLLDVWKSKLQELGFTVGEWSSESTFERKERPTPEEMAQIEKECGEKSCAGLCGKLGFGWCPLK